MRTTCWVPIVNALLYGEFDHGAGSAVHSLMYSGPVQTAAACSTHSHCDCSSCPSAAPLSKDCTKTISCKARCGPKLYHSIMKQRPMRDYFWRGHTKAVLQATASASKPPTGRHNVFDRIAAFVFNTSLLAHSSLDAV